MEHVRCVSGWDGAVRQMFSHKFRTAASNYFIVIEMRLKLNWNALVRVRECVCETDILPAERLPLSVWIYFKSFNKTLIRSQHQIMPLFLQLTNTCSCFVYVVFLYLCQNLRVFAVLVERATAAMISQRWSKQFATRIDFVLPAASYK